jgi:hypothetical protein
MAMQLRVIHIAAVLVGVCAAIGCCACCIENMGCLDIGDVKVHALGGTGDGPASRGKYS